MKGKFSELIAGQVPVLVDFHAVWCGPCKALAPILNEVKAEMGDSIKVIKIDVDQNPGLAGRYQVRGVPTLILFKDGELKWRQSGVVPKHELINTINAQLA